MSKQTNKSKLIKHSYTDKLNLLELNYHEDIQTHENGFDDLSPLISRIEDYSALKIQLLTKTNFRGNILELGAGTCWFGSMLSRLPEVREIYCLDMSECNLKILAPKAMEMLQAEADKITRVIGDFNKLYFPDNFFDFVVFDAALHHIILNNFKAVLCEVKRVLKQDGFVIAIREPFLPSIPFYKRYIKNKFGAREKQYGITENIYTKIEWQKMFHDAGFESEFIPFNLITGDGIIKKLFKHTKLKSLCPYLRPKYFIKLVPN